MPWGGGCKVSALGPYGPSSGLPSDLRYGFPELARFSLSRFRERLLLWRFGAPRAQPPALPTELPGSDMQKIGDNGTKSIL